MAPMVVAANSRGRYPRLPAEQRGNSEFMLGPRAAVARIAHQVQTACRRTLVPMRTLLVKTAATVANADGADGRVKWDERKRLRSRAACPLVRSPASDGRGSSPLERRGAVRLATWRRAIMRRSSRRAIARRPKHQRTHWAVSKSDLRAHRSSSVCRSVCVDFSAVCLRARGTPPRLH